MTSRISAACLILGTVMFFFYQSAMKDIRGMNAMLRARNARIEEMPDYPQFPSTARTREEREFERAWQMSTFNPEKALAKVRSAEIAMAIGEKRSNAVLLIGCAWAAWLGGGLMGIAAFVERKKPGVQPSSAKPNAPLDLGS